ncbi:MAG: hypothetical protein M1820_002713 [Bogoriella megaspora]|nr:MAG: hypothetical protein M1820_002713 [Bogoriella megaspora]
MSSRTEESLGEASWRDADQSTPQFLPTGDLPRRPKPNTSGKEIAITLNTFPVSQYPEKPVYQYDVMIGSGTEKRGLVKKAWECPTVHGLLGNGWIFDGNRIAWSQENKQKEIRVTVDLDQEYQRPARAKENKTTIVIRKATDVKFSQLDHWLAGKSDFNTNVLEAINFLDHLMRETPSQRYTQIKRSFFARGEQRFGLTGGVEAFKGVYQSIRPVHSPNGARLSVNVDVSNGTFWTESPVHLLAKEVCRARDLNDLVAKLRPQTDSHGNRKESPGFTNLKRMRKLGITVTHRGQDNGGATRYIIEKFLNVSPRDYKQKIKNRQTGVEEELTIVQYFQRAYNLPLQYPDLPLVQTTKKGVVLPMELCKVEGNQRYVFKLDERQTSNMIKFAVTPPAERWRAVEFGLSMLKWNEDKVLKNYGMRIETTPATVKARLLPNAKVGFGSGPMDPRTSGRWDLRGKKFAAPNNKLLNSWGVMVVQGRGAPDKGAVERFISEFIRVYTGHGGRVQNPRPPIILGGSDGDGGKMVETLWNHAGNAVQMRPQMLIFIVPDKNSDVYNRIKKSCECRYGVVSQVMQAAHVMKCQAQYISNVCMKFNGKLGGFTARAQGPKNHQQFGSYDKPTLIIGADVSHGAPGMKDAPSMACMTFSTNLLCTRFAAMVDTNGHRVEMITTANIDKFVKPMLKLWAQNVNSGQPPQQLIYLRDGVSEGQYQQVLSQEVNDIKEALKETYPKMPTKITVIVASKRHHIRFFPKPGDRDAADRNGNPNPGTLVETGVTHPFEYDFYLCAHSAIKGTARPVHYHVLEDQNKFDVNLLQQAIYDASYQYIRSTTPVSIHPAIYYAHLAAKRAGSHEQKASSSGPQTKGGHTGGSSGSQSSKSKEPGEFAPLIPMPNQGGIQHEMWYI